MTTQTKILSTIVGIVALGVGYWLVSPLFINVRVDESLFTDTDNTNLNEQIDSEAEMREYEDYMATAGKDEMVEESMPEIPKDFVSATGSFVDVAHEGTGEVQIVNVDGKYVVRFENLDVLNGPDLRVLLSKSSNVADSKDLGEYVELGKLKGNQGNQNYSVPEDIDVSLYNTVVIYCKPFHVVFNVASLERSE
ncbi:MAG: DM13 domain-containing protein [Candidatus Magasanikbacteria bacterium]|nr:DM13 domain-containing protein [Candidatus Magasanikbacteria bacterium]